MLLEAFTQSLKNQFSFIEGKRLLLAVSGGLDSMTLLHLYQQAALDISVAHCNFQLRGEASDGDADFVTQYCKKNNIPCFVNEFDTYAFAKAHTQSTQLAARNLRYEWFATLATEHHFDFICTAHHQDDAIETFLINLSRGTGIKGLTGIPERNQNIIRPLLSFSKTEIERYARSQGLQWREDASNTTDDYLRNHLRHHAIPKFVEATLNFKKGVVQTQKHLQETELLLSVYKEELKQRYTFPINSIQGPTGIGITIDQVVKHTAPRAVLYALLQDFGFTAWDDIYELLVAQTGKQVYSDSHRLIKNRDNLELFPLDNQPNISVLIDASQKRAEGEGWILFFDEADAVIPTTKNEIFVNRDRLTFPLEVRTWQEGDVFYPLGMQGKKKLSKYFKDEKLSLVAKEHIKLLCSGNEIIWVIGMRPDDRFKVTADTKTILKISYTNDTF